MKQNIGPIAIVIGVVILIAFFVFMYKKSFGGNPNQAPITAANAPAYAKAAAKNAGAVNPYAQNGTKGGSK